MWRRSTWCSCPQVSPSRTAPLPVRRNVQEPRLGAGPRVPRSAGRWGSGQLSLIRPGPAGRNPAPDASVPARRPAPGAGPSAALGRSNGGRPAVEDPGPEMGKTSGVPRRGAGPC